MTRIQSGFFNTSPVCSTLIGIRDTLDKDFCLASGLCSGLAWLGGKTPLSEVNYPLGHRKRRQEGIPAVMKKFNENTAMVFAAKQKNAIIAACTDAKKLEAMAVHEFVDLLVR